MESARSFVRDGVRFTLVEDFRELGRVLGAQEPGGLWDVLAVDEHMTAEIASFGQRVVLAMLAELRANYVPEAVKQDSDIEVEFENDRLRLKYYGSYQYTGRSTLVAVVNRINAFRQLLSRVLRELQGAG